MNAVEARGLSKRFGPKLALKDVSFDVRKGEIMGLLGPNGAGKTTTVRILTGILRPDSGSATVMGHDVLEEPLEIRRCIGYLPETPCLYERLTVEENLAFYGRLYDVPEEELRRRIRDLLALVGLKDRAGEKVGALSKGLKQRVAIVRALVHDPPVLILDQPTSDLDPASAKDIRGLIKELNRSGKTVLICTHNLTEAEELCDRIAIINEGCVLAVGKPGELVKDLEGSHHSFEISSFGSISKYLKVIEGLGGVLEVKQVGEDRAVVVLEDRKAISAVVRELILKGCDVLEVRMLRPGLEEVYMRLVRGP
ncbi:ABC transporter ATP-binding protein [Candidatus Bathyarchaeota archaeon ex4484_135]|nr:MAG: ABC transporter ATP-binding protein [Candidatus Bathyarchaeota archaeon ex4484_135]